MDLILGLTDDKVEQESSRNFLMDPRREYNKDVQYQA